MLELQRANVPGTPGRSSAHSKPTPGSGEEYVKVAVDVLISPDGPESILVAGAWSTSNAPESHALPCGRARSRWSGSGHAPAKSSAGLVEGIVSTGVSPPAAASVAASPGSVPCLSAPPNPHSVPLSTFPPVVVSLVSQF